MPDFKKPLILSLLLLSYVSFTIFFFINLPSRTANINSLDSLFFYVLAYVAGGTYYLSENLLITLLAVGGIKLLWHEIPFVALLGLIVIAGYSAENDGRPVDRRPARILRRRRGGRSDEKANANSIVNVDAQDANPKNTDTKQKLGAGDPGFLDAYPCDAPGNAPKNTPTKQKLGAGDPGFLGAYPCPPPLRAGDPGFLDAYPATSTPPTPATPASDSRLYMFRPQKFRNMRTAFIANSPLAKQHTKNGSAEKGKGKESAMEEANEEKGKGKECVGVNENGEVSIEKRLGAGDPGFLDQYPSPPRSIIPERKKMVSPEKKERVRVEQVMVKRVADVEYWRKYEAKREDLDWWKVVVEGKEREMRKRLGKKEMVEKKMEGEVDKRTVDKRKVDGSAVDEITVEEKKVNQNDLVENKKDEKHTGDEKESGMIKETKITEEKTSEDEKKAFGNNGIEDENAEGEDNKNTEDIKLKEKNAEQDIFAETNDLTESNIMEELKVEDIKREENNAEEDTFVDKTNDLTESDIMEELRMLSRNAKFSRTMKWTTRRTENRRRG
ncbi:hypothetical protein RUND412_010890 [Rhizina undulata]